MNRRGFTLIETIITIILMAVLGFMAAQVLSTTLRGSAESARQVTDLANAVSGMEQVIAVLNTKPLLEADAAARLTAAETAAKKLTVSATVKAAASAGNGNAILVTVTSGAVELSRVF